MNATDELCFTVALSAMGRLELADYGFRSWMLQDIDRPYQVALNLFNDQQARFEKLAEGRNPHCQLVIRSHPKPAFFNISAANNLGINLAGGRYIMFANSDVIYPSDTVRRIMSSIGDRDISYAVASRANMTSAQAASLKPVTEYRKPGDFDAIGDWTFESVWRGANGWIARTDVVRAIGGFDPKILVAEDDDLVDRIMHYVKRKNLQQAYYGLLDVFGYHIWHPSSELFDGYADAKIILDERHGRLKANPNGEDDVMPTPLGSFEALARQVQETVKPPSRYRKNTVKKVFKRVNRAFNE